MHAVYTVTHRTTLCGRQWRLDPEMRVETEWKLVTCKPCLRRVAEDTAMWEEVEELLAENE
jgi:hypothetical protein